MSASAPYAPRLEYAIGTKALRRTEYRCQAGSPVCILRASHKHPVSSTTAKDVPLRPGAIRWDAKRCRWVRADTGGYRTRSAQLSLEEAS